MTPPLGMSISFLQDLLQSGAMPLCMMVTSPRKTKDCKNIFKNPVERFILDRPIIGSFEYKSDNSYIDVWGRENKLSFFVFPMMAYLGCRQLNIAGFDFGGPRFFNNNTQHAFSIDQSSLDDPVYKIVNIWAKEWYDYHTYDKSTFPESIYCWTSLFEISNFLAKNFTISS